MLALALALALASLSLSVALDALQPLLEVVEVGGGRGGARGAVRVLLLEMRLA